MPSLSSIFNCSRLSFARRSWTALSVGVSVLFTLAVKHHYTHNTLSGILSNSEAILAYSFILISFPRPIRRIFRSLSAVHVTYPY